MGDPSLEPRSFQDLTHAMDAARQAAQLSTLMLAYLGQSPGKHEPLDLAALCRRSVAALRAPMPRDVALEANCAPSVLVISANATHIRQVLTNLVTNAWEACQARGAVQLTIKRVSTADIPTLHRFPIGWQPHGCAYACLEVTDNGCGIGEKNIDRLFDPFFSRKFSGRGLGLPVVLGIVRAHGGAITVESALGPRERFSRLPAAVRRKSPAPAAQTADCPAIDGRRRGAAGRRRTNDPQSSGGHAQAPGLPGAPGRGRRRGAGSILAASGMKSVACSAI